MIIDNNVYSDSIISIVESIGKEKFQEVVSNSTTIKEISSKLNIQMSNCSINYNTIRYIIKLWGINSENLKKKSGGKQRKLNLDIFKINSTCGRSTLKNTIIRYNLIEYKCCECGIGSEWNKKILTLQLDHINGINNDNRLENLRFLCPNCHSQTETYNGKGRLGNKKLNNGNYNKCNCGKRKSRISILCQECYSVKMNENIPSFYILNNINKFFSYKQIASFYNKCRSTINYWYKKNNIPVFINKYKCILTIEEFIPLIENENLEVEECIEKYRAIDVTAA